MPVSGTELRLTWNVPTDGVSYSVEQSVDGVNYASVTTVVMESDTSAVTDGMLPANSYYVRIVATNADGGKAIYDGGLVSTEESPDTSGWYQIGSIAADSPDGGPLFDEGTPDYTVNNAPIFAGSQQGAVLRAVQGLVSDGSLPSVDSDGNVKIYRVIKYGHELGGESMMSLAAPMAAAASSTRSTFTFDCSQYVPVASVIYNFVAGTVGVTGGGAKDTTTHGPGESSDDPVRYFDGSVDYKATDIESSGLGGFAQSRSWISSTQWSANYRNCPAEVACDS